MNDLPSEDAVILAEKEKYCQERCHFMLFDSVSFHPSLSTASRAASVAFSQVRAAKLVVAVTEPLEGAVRSQLGQKHCHSLAVAVSEPLEGTVRAQLGQKPYDNLAVAVTEPLEGTVRAVVRAAHINIFHPPHISCTIFVIHVERLKNEFRHQYAV